MDPRERDAVAAICVMAAFADGAKSNNERESLQRILEGLGGGELVLATQRVLLGQTGLGAEVANLVSPESKNLAFEMAVAVCAADGAANAAERDFLDRLRGTLGLDDASAAAVRERADRIAEAPHAESARADATGTGGDAAPSGTGAPATIGGEAEGRAAGPAAAAGPADAEIDRSILNTATLAGALELLPQSLSSMAIIPLQMKMVYEIGKRHGYTLDRGHVQDFLATAGVGLTGQVLENVARKLIGGIGRAAGGGLLGGLLGTASGVAVTFGTTWALGQVARTYYAGGRRLDVPALRSLFQSKLAEARNLYPRHQSEIQEKARTVDVSQLVSTLRS
jgi:uncharacterized protein (DUF697 family)/tellurite resistance protein